MDQKTDYYAVLQVQPTATLEEIKGAYKRLALLYHPDRSNHPQATLLMQKVNEAFDVLGNPEKKARYDQERIALAPEVEVKAEADPASPTQPIPVVRQEAEKREPVRSAPDPKLYLRLRNQFKIFLRLLYLTLILFVWSLAAGQVSAAAILVLVAACIYVIASTVYMIRRPFRRFR